MDFEILVLFKSKRFCVCLLCTPCLPPPYSLLLPGHMATQLEDYISQPPLQLGHIIMFLTKGMWAAVICTASLRGNCLPRTSFLLLSSSLNKDMQATQLPHRWGPSLRRWWSNQMEGTWVHEWSCGSELSHQLRSAWLMWNKNKPSHLSHYILRTLF